MAPLRRRLPFGLRVGLRRLPALARWAASPPSPLPRTPVEAFPVVHCQRSSPLRRQGTAWQDGLQQAKEHNVAWAARGLHRVTLAPGARLSWHDELGPPLRMRGTVPGPELHDGEVARGGGGGACQVANLVTWLAAHSGLEVLERHRHGWDLFPDDQRTVPFGLGATVFWPWHDLVLHNPHPFPVQLRLWLQDGQVHGEIAMPEAIADTWQVIEEQSRFLRDGADVLRTNQLVRVHTDANGRQTREPWAHHRARVRYPVPPESLESP